MLQWAVFVPFPSARFSDALQVRAALDPHASGMHCTALLLLAAAAARAATDVELNITTATFVHSTGPSFLNVNIDVGSLTNRLDTTDPYLHNLLRQLSNASNTGRGWAPMRIRYGGSAANGAHWNELGPGGPVGGNFQLNAVWWRALHALADDTRTTLQWGLAYDTAGGGAWNATNVAALLAYTGAHNLTRATAFSLGNELDLSSRTTQASYDAYARAYREFAALVRGTPGVSAAVVGPSRGLPREPPTITSFLVGAGGSDSLDSFSVHAYAIRCATWSVL